MKHNLIISLFALLLLVGCSKDEEGTSFVSFALDTEQAAVEGSFVQGATLPDNCKAVIPYVNAQGGTARLQADEVNGLSIPAMDVALEKGSGVIKIQVKGRPIDLGLTYLPVSVSYREHQYITTVPVVVFEDSDPNGTIDFSLATAPIVNMDGERTLTFTVSPTMAAVTVGELAGMVSKVTQDMAAGTGTITLTPSADFLSVTAQITANFGARPAVQKSVELNAFASGSGTAEAPYAVANEAQLKKINSGYNKFFKLTQDINLAGNWTPLCQENALTGGLDGDNHTVTYQIQAAEGDNLGFFARIGSTATVKNLKVSGSITGRNTLAGVAASSDATLTNCTSQVAVKGENTLAVLVASGSKKDADVLTVGASFPKLINILAGSTHASEALDVNPKNVTVTVLSNTTGAVIAYDAATGKISADISGGGFTKGDIKVEVKLGALVALTQRTITIDSKKMFESGSGTAGDPYIVINGEQLAITMASHTGSYIKLGANVTLATPWQTVPSFTGDLNGDGHTVSGLVINNTTKDYGFVGTNEGKIHDLKFAGVSVTTSAAMGTVAGINKGTIEHVEIAGTITSTHTGDVLGGIAGENINQGVINNCYVNVNMTATCGMVGGIVGRNKGTGAGAQVTNCTAGGTLTLNGSKNRIGGIVGRGEGPDLIKGCLCTMNIQAVTAGANGVGGIFGANNNDNMKVEECMFTGIVKSGNDVGGIGGVAANVMNCLVENASVANTTAGSNGNAAGICGTGKVYTKYSIVRSSAIEGVSGTGKAISGINGNYQSNGTTISCVVQNTSIKGGAVKRIAAITATGMAGNWTSGVTLLNGAGDDITDTAVNSAAGEDGGSMSAAELTQAFYEGLGYNFTSVWIMKEGKPSLRNVGYKQK